MLNTGNTPTYEGITAQKPGYWAAFTNSYITNGITNVVNIEMIQVCQGATIVGNVVNALTQAPITNATVSTYSGGYYTNVMTDTNGDFILTNITVGNDNSPVQSTLTASAPGFNPQSRTVTIFCDATISTTFGVPETNFGAIQGFVTNVLTGQSISNVFIGSSFGGATTTDTNGYYILNQVPLGANGTNKTWTVTAIPTGFPSQTKSVLVSANTTNELDFGFGQPLTELVISATGTPNPVNVGSNLTYSITLTNLKADATNVVLTDTLPPGVTFLSASITNNPGGFGTPVQSNGIVTVDGSNLSSNAGVVLLITCDTRNCAGSLTNVVTVTSDTPDVSPGSSNHTATSHWHGTGALASLRGCRYHNDRHAQSCFGQQSTDLSARRCHKHRPGNCAFSQPGGYVAGQLDLWEYHSQPRHLQLEPRRYTVEHRQSCLHPRPLTATIVVLPLQSPGRWTTPRPFPLARRKSRSRIMILTITQTASSRLSRRRL